MSKLPLLLPLVFLTACNSLSVHTDYDPQVDFSALEEWAWIKPVKTVLPDENAETQLASQRIKSAVEAELASKGFVQVQDEAQADFLVAAHAAVTRKYDSAYVNDNFGYGGYGGYDWNYGYGYGFGIGAPTVYEYEQGTLGIDILTQASRKVMWNGTAKDVFHRKNSVEKREKVVRDTVAKLLSKFPPE
jgi:hypothetical protein